MRKVIYEKIDWNPNENIKVLSFNFKRPATETIPIHWHRSLEIIMPIEGTVNIWWEGKNCWIGPGEVMIITSNSLHSCQLAASTNKYTGFAFQISYDYLLKIFPQYINSTLDNNYSVDEYRQIISFLEKIVLLKNTHDKFTSYMIDGYLLVLISLIFEKHLHPIKLSSKDNQKKDLINILNYLDTNFQKPINLKKLAKQFNFSYGHLARIFKNNIGMTMHEYLTYNRLTQSKLDLIRKDTTLINIALNNGFNNYKSFNRAFIKKYGLTPTQYRKTLEKS